MNQQAAMTITCPNGHGGPPPEGGRFCDQCGSRLVAVPASSQAANPPAMNGQFNQVARQNYAPVQNHPQQAFSPAMPYGRGAFCASCGGGGRNLAPGVHLCKECRWLRPLAPGYSVDCAAFQWAQDGAAMQKLRSIGPLNSMARSVSDKVGRRWIETTLNGVRLGEKQLPEVYAQAVQAARILGMSYMPDIYVSGEWLWDAATYGSDDNAFIVLGSALVTNFRGRDLLFLLAREMGHCRAGHALWKTVIRFLVGERGPRKGLMAGGVLAALNPGNMIEGAIELPLLGWARQSEITADRAGLLAVGDEETARRVLLSWSLKSAMLYRHINIEAWLEQQEDSDDETLKLSEMMMSSTPYITRRLKLLSQFAQSDEIRYWHGRVRSLVPQTPKPAPPVRRPAAPGPSPSKDQMRIVCSSCKTGMRVPQSALAGKNVLRVRCPNAQCEKVVALKKKAAPAPPMSERNGYSE